MNNEIINNLEEFDMIEIPPNMKGDYVKCEFGGIGYMLLNRIPIEQQARELYLGESLNGICPTLYAGIDFKDGDNHHDTEGNYLSLESELEDYEETAIKEHTQLSIYQYFPREVLTEEFIKKLIEYNTKQIKEFNHLIECDGHDDFHTFAVAFQGNRKGMTVTVVRNTYIVNCHLCEEYSNETLFTQEKEQTSQGYTCISCTDKQKEEDEEDEL